jgi:hypothetical protein
MVGRSRIRASFALLGTRPGSEIRRPGPSPPAPPRNLPGTCSRTLRNTTLPNNTDRPLNTTRWPCGHSSSPSSPKPMSPMQSISGGRCPSMRTTTDKSQAEQLGDAADPPRQHLPELVPLPGDGPRSMDQVSAVLPVAPAARRVGVRGQPVGIDSAASQVNAAAS